jgi:hypothetical protein
MKDGGPEDIELPHDASEVEAHGCKAVDFDAVVFGSAQSRDGADVIFVSYVGMLDDGDTLRVEAGIIGNLNGNIEGEDTISNMFVGQKHTIAQDDLDRYVLGKLDHLKELRMFERFPARDHQQHKLATVNQIDDLLESVEGHVVAIGASLDHAVFAAHATTIGDPYQHYSVSWMN